MDNVLLHVRAVLSTTPMRWQQLVETIPSELLNRPPAPQEWSAFACLQHLLATERLFFPVRVRNFLAGEKELATYDPDTQGNPHAGRTAAELVAEFTTLRAESLSLVATITEADLMRTARHSELGSAALRDILHGWGAHDLDHTIQAERALMQPFIAGSGPWRRYFSANDVERP